VIFFRIYFSIQGVSKLSAHACANGSGWREALFSFAEGLQMRVMSLLLELRDPRLRERSPRWSQLSAMESTR
jgi:hypothetical protein